MGGDVMVTAPLTFKQWIMCVGIGMLSLVWGGVVVQPLSLAFFGPAFESTDDNTKKKR